jgi:hypothetical protein
MMTRNNTILEILFLLITLALLSCSSDHKGLDKTTRQKIESLARTEMIRLDDSIKVACDSIYQLTFNHVKDSLFEVRTREIEQIILEEY